MSKDLMRLPIISLAIGVLLRISDYIIAVFLVRSTNVWTLEMGPTAFYIRLVLSAVLFIIGGILLKKIDKKVIFKSATLLVIYSILVFFLEQVVQYFGTYNMGIYWLFLPVELYTNITSALARISSVETINWWYALPSLVAPYLFVLFGKGSRKSFIDN